jgi:hypothetical protein
MKALAAIASPLPADMPVDARAAFANCTWFR